MYKFLLFLISLSLLGISSLQAQSDPLEASKSYTDNKAHTILRDYIELLKIPNVASDLPNINRNAEALMNAFEERGVNMELLTLPDYPDAPPVIYGELNTPGADRTLNVYVHYDGQPVDPGNWTHNPWEPTLYSGPMDRGGKPIPFPSADQPVDPDWRIYGRSASDDKAPFPALLSALDAHRESEIPLTSNLKFFFDGEEEIGSPHIPYYLERYKDKLAGDLWLIFDGPKHQSGRPQVVFGVRGVTGMEVTVYGPHRPLHSGHYGGWSPVPGQMLADLLASMKNETGEILIEGFNDETEPVTQSDREAFATLPDVDDQIRDELGLSWTEFEGRSLIESYMYPTLTVRGLQSGNTGELARNVIPTQATANLGVRLAKGNDPEEMLDKVERHIRSRGYHIVYDEPDIDTKRKHRKIAKVTRSAGYPAMRTSIDNPMSSMVSRAIDEATEEDLILYPTMGGTLPLYHFEKILDVPIIIVPIANHDNNQHAPDENIRIGNIWYGINIYSAIFTME